MSQHRRQFLADVGKGMLVAGVGSTLAAELGAEPCPLENPPNRISFGAIEPLAALMQESPPEKLLPILVEKIRSGVDLQFLTAAGALANARTFGGHDYDGYHSFMALGPAFSMSKECSPDRAALPVLKVLYRNAVHIQKFGGRAKESLHDLERLHPGQTSPASVGDLKSAALAMKIPDAESRLARLTADSDRKAFEELQACIQDDVDVHRVVLAWRAWSTLDLTGHDHALTLFRQSVRFCIDSERNRAVCKRAVPSIRALLPKLLDQYKLLGRTDGRVPADDQWIDETSREIFMADREVAAEVAAAALAKGVPTRDLAEAICLAANRLVLCDPGRSRDEPGKPKGSVHGASIGVHASDAANAWRNIAKVCTWKNTAASLIVAAYHTAGQGSQASNPTLPTADALAAIKATDPAQLLSETDAAIRANDQTRAAAAVKKYGDLGHPSGPVFQHLLRFAVSEDGALHAEKYYRTVVEEFASTRPAFRWRQLIGLARVTASEFGYPAPGYKLACELLRV